MSGLNPGKPLFNLLLVAALGFGSIQGLQAQQDTESANQPAQWCTWNPEPGSELPGMGQKIVLISGDEEYRSEEALPMLGKLLARRLGYTCYGLFAIDRETGEINPNEQGNIPGMHLLEDADLVIIALRFRNLPDEQMKYFDQYLNSGKPVIALRTSTHAFQYPRDSDSAFSRYGTGSREWRGGFGKQVLGETWVNHHGDHGSQSTRGLPNAEQADHLLLTGVDDVWGPTDVYGIRDLPEGTTVLLWGQVLEGMQPDSPPAAGEKNDPMMPLAWIREHKLESGTSVPVFCTTMGAATDFESAGLRRLIVNAALSMTGHEKAIEDVSDVGPVGEFQPTDFGFNRFREGLAPADYQ